MTEFELHIAKRLCLSAGCSMFIDKHGHVGTGVKGPLCFLIFVLTAYDTLSIEKTLSFSYIFLH